LKSLNDIRSVPVILKKVGEAAANDATELEGLCHYLVHHQNELEEALLAARVHEFMEDLFLRKTELFLIADGQVLFARERNTLVGNYFAPIFEPSPGGLSTFMSTWARTENPDQILHFLDFGTYSKDPGFAHYLLFSNPALSRLYDNKHELKEMFEKAGPLVSKPAFSDWAARTRQSIGL